VNTNFQELTILIIDDSSLDRGVYSAYILDRHSSTEPMRSIGGLADILKLCQERSPDLVLLNFARGKDRGLDFIADLQLAAGDSLLPPISSLPDLANPEPFTAMPLARDPAPPERRVTPLSLSEELAATKKLLAQRDRELAAFTALASADLRAPLKGIANLATWLAEDLDSYLTPDTRKQFDLLQARVHRMRLLVKDLLEYTQAGQQPMTRSIVNVGELLTKIIGSFSLGAEFTIEIATPMPTLRTDRFALQHVLTNLIDNAVKHHHRPDGRVRIVSQPQQNGYLFEISDDGTGIAPQDRERIFEVFQSLSPQNEISTGMGLAIAKKKIELQGGKIWVDSTPGVGSKFSFTWPDASSMVRSS
jgi:signal transduction histidine kinase